MQVREFLTCDYNTFIEFSTDFYNTDSVSHSIPQSYIKTTFEEIVKGSPYIKGFLILENNIPAGYALICYTYSIEAGGMIGVLDEFYISPSFQSQGLGTEFLSYMKTNLSHGLKAFRLEFVPAKKNLQKLYEKMGFKKMKYASMFCKL